MNLLKKKSRRMPLKAGWMILLLVIITACADKQVNGMTQEENSAQTVPGEAIHPLKNNDDLDVLLEEIGDAEIVLLGEATHGTSEFYTWRAQISQRLIAEKGFTVIAVEGDWSDALPLNNYIRGNSNYSSAEIALQQFDRWPTWMWANEEVAQLAEWLKNHNSGQTAKEQAGFYGLDVYGIWESLKAVHAYLQKINPAAAETSRAVLDCFAPYDEDENAYARSTAGNSGSCEDEINEMFTTVETIVGDQKSLTQAEFNALQHAIVVANAETYYRTAARSSSASWNVRDLHMTGTIDRLLDHHGPGTKMIVWEHNTHVGDARATDMKDAGMVNVGQLVREEYGEENVYIVGFGTYSGEVIAASSWGAAAKVMEVPPAQRNSWERILHAQKPDDKIILMEPLKNLPDFQHRIGHRAIGVVYNPRRESGNYVPSVLPERYDAFIFIDETNALRPLE